MTPRRSVWPLLTLLVTACAGESAARIEEAPPETSPAPTAAAPSAEPTAEPPEEPTAGEPTEPDFEASLPEGECPEVLVRVAHREPMALPPLLTEAVAFRSEDGRHVRVVLSDQPLVQDEMGRFADPDAGHARFEMDAIRQRRRPLEPRILGGPDATRGALSHARIVSAGPLLTFGHREIGSVELTLVDETRVCGRIDLDDGFSRVRGGFSAPVRGPLPP